MWTSLVSYSFKHILYTSKHIACVLKSLSYNTEQQETEHSAVSDRHQSDTPKNNSAWILHIRNSVCACTGTYVPNHTCVFILELLYHHCFSQIHCFLNMFRNSVNMWLQDPDIIIFRKITNRQVTQKKKYMTHQYFLDICCQRKQTGHKSKSI